MTTPLPPPTPSPADYRTYRALHLSNSLTLLLANDPTATKSSASLSVSVGAASDPPGFEGLAHYCEHMLFLGSEAFPSENHYKKTLASHGGASNASTSMERTTYKFDVIASHLPDVLPIFASNFIAPLFNQEGMNREVLAVDSEDTKNRTKDGRRRLQILKAIGQNNASNYTKFSTGNSGTIMASDTDRTPEYTQTVLKAFYQTHYDPSRIACVIIGPQSLDDLEALAVPLLQSIPKPDVRDPIPSAIAALLNSDLPPPLSSTTPPPFSPSWSTPSPTLLTISPLSPSVRTLSLNFPLPPQRHKLTSPPTRLTSHLLGHEAPGSAFAILQDTALITSLSAGMRMEDTVQSLFTVTVGLTEKGLGRYKEVAQILFDHITLLRTSPPSSLRALWGEMSQLSQMHFAMSPPRSPYATTPALAQRLHTHTTENCLTAGAMVGEDETTFPAQDFREVMGHFTTDNCLVELFSQKAYEDAVGDPSTTRHIEKYYDIEYATTPNEADLRKWATSTSPASTRLCLPKPNTYIPRTLELVDGAEKAPRLEKPIEPPVLIDSSSRGRLHFRQDDRYALPTSSLSVLLRNPWVQHSLDASGNFAYDVENEAMSSLFTAVYNCKLAQETYSASEAGLGYVFSCTSAGINLIVSGYSDKLPAFVGKMLSLAMRPEHLIEDELFEVVKERRLRRLRATHMQRSDELCDYYAEAFLSPEKRSCEEMEAVTARITKNMIVEHLRKMLDPKNIFAEALATGNTTEGQALEWWQGVQATVFGDDAGATTLTNLKFVPGSSFRYLPPSCDYELHNQHKNEEEKCGAVVYAYQGDGLSYIGDRVGAAQSLRKTATLKLLAAMVKEPIFNTLRTKMTLGYIVSSGIQTHFSTCSPNEKTGAGAYACENIQHFYVTVVSDKMDPVSVGAAIDKFFEDWRDVLKNTPEAEIENYVDSLRRKMLEPFKKLGEEAAVHRAKIRRFAPEVAGNVDRQGDLLRAVPWESDDLLAAELTKVTRSDLIACYEKVIVGKERSRVGSYVYGNKFRKGGGAEGGKGAGIWGGGRNVEVLDGYEGARKRGQTMGEVGLIGRGGGGGGAGGGWGGKRLLLGLGIGGFCVGLGVWGWSKFMGGDGRGKGGQVEWSLKGVKRIAFGGKSL